MASNRRRRSKRSIYVAASKPDSPEHHEYAETAVANRAGEISNACMICGPSGIITMKSMMIVNCVSASSHSRRRSCDSFNESNAWLRLIEASVVEIFVDGLLALFPVCRRADTRFIDAAFIDEQRAHGAHRCRFARCPHVAFAVWEERFAHRFKQLCASICAFAAITPFDIQIGLRIELDARGRIGDFDHGRDARALRQFRE